MSSAPAIKLNGQPGHLFAGGFTGSICFVPAAAIRGETLDLAAYHTSQWATINVRLNPSITIGSHLYPVLSEPVLDAERAAAFVKRSKKLR